MRSLPCSGVRRPQKSDGRQLLLRPCRERPSRRRTADERNDIAPSHVEHGAPQTSLLSERKPAGASWQQPWFEIRSVSVLGTLDVPEYPRKADTTRRLLNRRF